jgi:polar amino acid transport system substrate-binding protein
MSSRSRKGRAAAYAVIALLGAVLTHRAEAGVVSACVDSASPTGTIDARVARAALRSQGAELHIVSYVGVGKGGDGFPIGKFARMANSDCELILGFPIDVGDPHLPPDVQATHAYARTGFVLVRGVEQRAHKLEDFPRGSEVGIAQLDTYAGVLFSEHPNIVMHVYPDDAQMIADVTKRKITAALAWQPSLQRLPPVTMSRVTTEPLPGRHMRWDLVALYAGAAQQQAVLFDQGLKVLRQHNQLATLIRPYQDAGDPTPAASTSGVASPSSMRARAALRHESRDASFRIVRRTVKTGNACGAKLPPAIYTQEQAEQGAKVYAQNCAACHGPQLQGQPGGFTGPALRGADFADPSYKFHVSDIFNFVSKLMPAPSPGSLTQEEDVQVMSFLLQQNGYPAGGHELTYAQAEHSKIPLRFYPK